MSPMAYYPLGEPEGATRASNVSTSKQPELTQTGTGTAVTFGTATGPPTDGLTAATFAGGKYLRADGTALSGTVARLECFVATTSTTTSTIMYLRDSTALTPQLLRVSLRADGTVRAAYEDDFAGTWWATSTGTINDGATHHLLAEVVASDLLRLYIDGVLAASIATPFTSATFSYFSVGNDPLSGTPTFTGALSHVAATGTSTAILAARILAHYQAGTTGFAGERTDQRIARLASYADIPTAEQTLSTGVGTVAHRDPTGATPLDLMRQVEATEAGILFDGRNGNLVFQNRQARYNAASSFTLDAASQQVEADLEPVLDDQFLDNDVTASDGTTSARAVDTASVTEHGPRRKSLDLIPASAVELGYAADWHLYRFKDPVARLRQVTVRVDQLPTALASAVLAADLGTRFTLTGLPSQAPASSMSLFVEGYTETITNESYTVTFDVSEASVMDVCQLDSATHAQLDSTAILAY